jgi:protein-export membrane protein SecD
MRNYYIKSSLWGLSVLISLYLLYPTFKYFSLPTVQDKQAMEAQEPDLVARSIAMGLDLQGGIRFVMEVDESKEKKDSLHSRRSQINEEQVATDGGNVTVKKKVKGSDALDRAREIIENRVNQTGLREADVKKLGSNRLMIELPGYHNIDAAKKLIGQTAKLFFKLVREGEDIQPVLDAMDVALVRARSGVADTGADTAASKPAVAATPEQKEADLIFGTGSQSSTPAPPAVDSGKKEITDKILADLDPEKPLRNLLFSQENDIVVREADVSKVKYILDHPAILRVIPKHSEFLWSAKPDTMENGQIIRNLFLVKAAAELDGSALKYATVRPPSAASMDPGPSVDLELNSSGAKIFGKVTGANVNRRLAIVLDNTVYSAPVIRTKITEGNAQITGSFNIEEAQRLAIVLRAGALPVELKFVEERTVGPTLGKEYIARGLNSILISMVLITIFMCVYYRMAGVYSIIALLLNLLFLMAILAGFKLTLTLPGIAGIVLTIGMSVDANVIIFERIRDELRLGKTNRGAIEGGYQHAFLTILDQHSTTLITAIILYQFGTGPIKGFAVTLGVGIVFNFITAIYLTRHIHNYHMLQPGQPKLSI